MKKKIKYIVLWVLVAAYMVVALGFDSGKQQHLVCNQVDVYILDSDRSAFITLAIVKNLLQKMGVNLIVKTFSEIDLNKLEIMLNNCPPIGKAEAYKTIGGKVVIEIRQRSPILRVMDANN